MMSPMRGSLALFLTALLASCGSVQPPPSNALASAAELDPEKQGAELAAKGVAPRGDAPKVSKVVLNDKEFEVHELIVKPRGSTFDLVRYLLTPNEWMLTKLVYERDGTRIYEFRRIVSKGPRVEVDPFKPVPKPPVRER